MDLTLFCRSASVGSASSNEVIVLLKDVNTKSLGIEADIVLPHLDPADIMSAVDPDLYLSTHTDDILAAMERAGYVVGAP